MKYGFIGCGNMGGAIATALRNSTRDFALTDRSGRGNALADTLEVPYLPENNKIVQRCERVFLGVKPQMMAGVLAELQNDLAEQKPLLITMAAGLSMNQITDMAGTELPVIRIMPNTPAAIGKGVILYCANDLVDPEILKDFLQDMTPCGWLEPLEERLMDAGSALSGSSPAFVYMFMEALADGAVACGIPRAKAQELAAMTVIGAGEMLLQSGKHPGELKDAVCSPAGSTIEGVRTLEQQGMRSAVTEALCATFARNRSLGK